MYTQKFKIMLKEIKILINSKITLIIWQCNIVKIAKFSKLNSRFKGISIKMPHGFFAKIETLIKKKSYRNARNSD